MLLLLLLRKVGREGPGPGVRLHAASRLWPVCAISRILPRVGKAMRIVEDRHRGEAYSVGVVSGGSEAL